MDNAGEQADDTKSFQDRMMHLPGGRCECLYSDPQREQSKSLNETGVKVLSLGAKAIMLEGNLPLDGMLL
eukprot:COSAG05_NODE_162_length_15499_cov_23.006104_3_plen_70_part_00